MYAYQVKSSTTEGRQVLDIRKTLVDARKFVETMMLRYEGINSDDEGRLAQNLYSMRSPEGNQERLEFKMKGLKAFYDVLRGLNPKTPSDIKYLQWYDPAIREKSSEGSAFLQAQRKLETLRELVNQFERDTAGISALRDDLAKLSTEVFDPIGETIISTDTPEIRMNTVINCVTELAKGLKGVQMAFPANVGLLQREVR